MYLLVDLNTDGAPGEITDATDAALVELVRHNHVGSAVSLVVAVVTDLEGPLIGL